MCPPRGWRRVIPISTPARRRRLLGDAMDNAARALENFHRSWQPAVELERSRRRANDAVREAGTNGVAGVGPVESLFDTTREQLSVAEVWQSERPTLARALLPAEWTYIEAGVAAAEDARARLAQTPDLDPVASFAPTIEDFARSIDLNLRMMEPAIRVLSDLSERDLRMPWRRWWARARPRIRELTNKVRRGF